MALSTREKQLKRAARLAKASREMRINRLLWSGMIKSADEIPAGAIPALPSDQNKGSNWGEYRVRRWYQDNEFKCKDCGKEETWSAVEQLHYYEIAKGKAINEPTRCFECRIKHAARAKADTERMLEAQQSRKENQDSEQGGGHKR